LTGVYRFEADIAEQGLGLVNALQAAVVELLMNPARLV